MLGVNVSALLTGAGLVGVIVGLSAQNTVKDLLAGMFILLEKQYRVGDVITLSGGSTGPVGITGKVEEITLRITKLRAFDGTHITVRNGEPTVITNQTFSYASVVLDVSVTYDSDIAVVQKTMDGIGKELMAATKWKDMIIEPITFVRIDNFTDTGVVVRAVGTVSPASQWDVAGEYRRRLLSTFKTLPNVTLAHS
jgi:small conductance mechanosensitive channel